MMFDERNETYEQAMNFYRSIGRDMGLEEEEEEERDWTKETFQEFLERKDRKGRETVCVRKTDAEHDIPQVRMESLTVAELWDCVEALMVLVDTRANKGLYKAGGDYKERKREAWAWAEEALKNAGLMEVPE